MIAQQYREIDDLNLAACLLSLGFDLKNREIFDHRDLTSQGHDRPSLAVYHFAEKSLAGLSLSTVRAQWQSGVPREDPRNAVERMRLALHNYRVLQWARKTPGVPLFVSAIGSAYKLHNGSAPGASPVSQSPAPAAPASVSIGIREAASALACGSHLQSVVWASEKSPCLIGDAPSRPASVTAALVSDEKWLYDPSNMDPLALCVASLYNRGELLRTSNLAARAYVLRASSGSLAVMAASAPPATRALVAKHLSK